MAKTKDIAAFIRKELASDLDLADAVKREAFNADVATAIFEARKQAGFTQKQLAERAGTHQSVIARLEDADYDGHSLTMLRRIGDALGKELRVRYCDAIEADEDYPLVQDFSPGWNVRQEWHPSVRDTEFAEDQVQPSEIK